jgi:hypothetical protein
VLNEPPEFTVTSPVNVFVPELLLSVRVPAIVAVPPSAKLLAVIVKVRLALTVRFLMLTGAFA